MVVGIGQVPDPQQVRGLFGSDSGRCARILGRVQIQGPQPHGLATWAIQPPHGGRSQVLRQPAVLHDQKVVGKAVQIVEAVLDQDHGQAPVLQAAQDLRQAGHRLDVQVAGGLVQDQNLRVHHAGGGDGDHLLLAPRQGEDVPVHKRGDAEEVSHLVYALTDGFRLDPGVLQGEGQLAADVGGEELGLGILEDRPHLLRKTVDGSGRGGFALDQALSLQLALVELGNQAVDNPGQGGLAATARSGDHGQPARSHPAGDLFEGRPAGALVGEAKPGTLQHRLHIP